MMQMVTADKSIIRSVNWTTEYYPYSIDPVVSPENIIVEPEVQQRWREWAKGKCHSRQISSEMYELLLMYNLPCNLEDLERRITSGFYFKRFTMDEDGAPPGRFKMVNERKPARLGKNIEEVSYMYSGNFNNFLELMLEGEAEPGIFTKYCQMSEQTAFIWETIARTATIDFAFMRDDYEDESIFAVTIVGGRCNLVAQVQPGLVRTRMTRDQPITFNDTFWYHLRNMHVRLKVLFLCLFTEFNPSKLWVMLPDFIGVLENLHLECEKIKRDVQMVNDAREQLLYVNDVVEAAEVDPGLQTDKVSSDSVLQAIEEEVLQLEPLPNWAQVVLKGDNTSLWQGNALIDIAVYKSVDVLVPKYLAMRSALHEVIEPMEESIEYSSEFKNNPVVVWNKWSYPTVHYNGVAENAIYFMGNVNLISVGERIDVEPRMVRQWNTALWWDVVKERGNVVLGVDLDYDALNIVSLNLLDSYLAVNVEARLPILPRRLMLRVYSPQTTNGMLFLANYIAKLVHWYVVREIASLSVFDTSLTFEFDRRERVNADMFTLWQVKYMTSERAQDIWESLSWRLEFESWQRTKKIKRLLVLYLVKRAKHQMKVMRRLIDSYIGHCLKDERVVESEMPSLQNEKKSKMRPP